MGLGIYSPYTVFVKDGAVEEVVSLHRHKAEVARKRRRRDAQEVQQTQFPGRLYTCARTVTRGGFSGYTEPCTRVVED